MNGLIEALKQIKDERSPSGRRHPLWFILLLVILGLMTKHLTYRALGRFALHHSYQLGRSCGIRHPSRPSYSTFRRVLMGLDWHQLINAFNQWASQLTLTNSPGDCLTIDGKALRSTLRYYSLYKRNFVSIVSCFCQENGLVLAMDSRQQITKTETQSAQEIIRNLTSDNQVVTLDAIHCQKPTVQNIIDGNNDYLITVKNNQKNLRKTLHDLAITTTPLSQYTELDKSRGRRIQRTISVFSLPENIKSAWLNSQRFIQVTRIGTRKYKPVDQTVYYLSSRQDNAQTFAAKIRGHWLIENQLHWVRDTIFKEDLSPICHFQAVTNLSILLTIAINLFRILGFRSITNGQTWLYGRLWTLAPLLE